MPEVELRVRPVTRFNLTRWHTSEQGSGIETLGEFDSERDAMRALNAFALAEQPHPSVPLMPDGASIRWSEDDPPSSEYPAPQG